MRWPSLNVRTWQRPHLWDGTDTRLRGRCNCTPVLRALCKPALPTCTSHSLALLTQRPFVFPTPFLSPWSHCTCCCLHLEHIFFQSGLVKTSKYSRPGSNITSSGQWGHNQMCLVLAFIKSVIVQHSAMVSFMHQLVWLAMRCPIRHYFWTCLWGSFRMRLHLNWWT